MPNGGGFEGGGRGAHIGRGGGGFDGRKRPGEWRGFLRPLMTTTGGRRSADVSMTSCPFFYSFSFFCKSLITF